MLDKGECREWADRVKSEPDGLAAFKFNALVRAGSTALPGAGSGPAVGSTLANAFRSSGKGGFPYSTTLDGEDFRGAGKGYMNVREAAGDDIDIPSSKTYIDWLMEDVTTHARMHARQ
jgi:hypothetical protein